MTLLLSYRPFPCRRSFPVLEDRNPPGNADSPQTSHNVGIYVLAVAESKASVGTLYLESELLVEGDRGRVIHVHAEIQSRKTQPVIRKVHASVHQLCTDAFSLPVIPHRYTEVPGVSCSGVHVDTEGEAPDDLTLYAGHD